MKTGKSCSHYRSNCLFMAFNEDVNLKVLEGRSVCRHVWFPYNQQWPIKALRSRCVDSLANQKLKSPLVLNQKEAEIWPSRIFGSDTHGLPWLTTGNFSRRIQSKIYCVVVLTLMMTVIAWQPDRSHSLCTLMRLSYACMIVYESSKWEFEIKNIFYTTVLTNKHNTVIIQPFNFE